MSYIASEKIKMFPVGNRGNGINVEAAETTEKNITQILNSIYSRKNFVISGDKSAGNLELVLGGYYFNIVGDTEDTDRHTALSNLTGDLYAYVAINKTDSVYNRLCKINDSTISTGILDDSGEFRGLCITTSVPTSDTYDIESIQIFDSAGNIPKASKVHWTTDEILDSTTSSVSEQFTTDKLILGTTSTTSAYPSLVIDNNNEVLRRDLSGTVSVDSHKIITTISQDKSGKVTLSSATITVSPGTNQGDINVYGVNGSVNGLGMDGDPTFSSVTATNIYISDGQLYGNASTANELQTARTLSLSGDITGSVSTAWSSDATISTTIGDKKVTAAKLAEKYNYIEATISEKTLTITITNNKENSSN